MTLYLKQFYESPMGLLSIIVSKEGLGELDFYDPKEKVIHEIKKSTSKEEAYIWQVKYYLLLFEREGIADVVGMLEYPLLRETMRVELEEGDREILRQMEVEIRQLIGEEACPPALSKGKCGACSYYEFCYSGEGEWNRE